MSRNRSRRREERIRADVKHQAELARLADERTRDGLAPSSPLPSRSGFAIDLDLLDSSSSSTEPSGKSSEYFASAELSETASTRKASTGGRKAKRPRLAHADERPLNDATHSRGLRSTDARSRYRDFKKLRSPPFTNSHLDQPGDPTGRLRRRNTKSISPLTLPSDLAWNGRNGRATRRNAKETRDIRSRRQSEHEDQLEDRLFPLFDEASTSPTPEPHHTSEQRHNDHDNEPEGTLFLPHAPLHRLGVRGDRPAVNYDPLPDPMPSGPRRSRSRSRSRRSSTSNVRRASSARRSQRMSPVAVPDQEKLYAASGELADFAFRTLNSLIDLEYHEPNMTFLYDIGHNLSLDYLRYAAQAFSAALYDAELEEVDRP